MYVFPKKVTLLITAKQKVQYDVQHRCVTPQLSLLLIVSLCRVSLHDNMEFNAAFVFFKSFSAKHGKKGKEKRNDYSVIEQSALKRQLYGNILKGSHPKMTGQNDRQDESLTGQVHDQAGHCPLTGRYFEPCNNR